jgi:hypothetical protein
MRAIAERIGDLLRAEVRLIRGFIRDPGRHWFR